MRKMGIGLGVGINRSNYAQGIFNAYSARVVADGGVVEGGSCVDAVSSLLQSASLLLIPSGYKGGKLYAEIPTNGNGDLTWTRTSTAIRTNSSGLLESMATGVPRLSYMYGSCPSALLEPQRTNIMLNSENLNSWLKIDTSVTNNSTTSPDGTQNADTVTATGSGSLSHLIYQNLAFTSGTAYTMSVFAKANTSNFIQLLFSGDFVANSYANFNLSNGTITASANLTPKIESIGNGWYRCSISATAGATGLNSQIIYLINSGTASRGQAFTANGESVYLWGGQFEAGAYPTTYIPTTSATATRVADSFSRNNIYTNGLISASGGTWFVELRGNEIRTLTTETVGAGLELGNSSGASTEAFKFRRGGGSQRVNIWKIESGISSALYTLITDYAKVAIKWNGTSADVFVNGTKVVSATSFTATTSLEFLRYIADQFPTFIQQMALFSTPLSDTDCTTLTT